MYFIVVSLMGDLYLPSDLKRSKHEVMTVNMFIQLKSRWGSVRKFRGCRFGFRLKYSRCEE